MIDHIQARRKTGPIRVWINDKIHAWTPATVSRIDHTTVELILPELNNQV